MPTRRDAAPARAAARGAGADAVLVKSDWGWIPDVFARRYLSSDAVRESSAGGASADARAPKPMLLHVSGAHPPPWLDPDDAARRLDDDDGGARDGDDARGADGADGLAFDRWQAHAGA